MFHRGSETIYLLLYFDDIIFMASSSSFITKVTTRLTTKLLITDLDSLSFFLGSVASRTEQGLFLSQTMFAKEIIARVDMTICNPFNTPTYTRTKISSFEKHVADPTLNRSFCGAL